MNFLLTIFLLIMLPSIVFAKGFFIASYVFGDGDISTIASKFNFIITSEDEASSVTTIKATNPSAKAIFYDNALTHGGDAGYVISDINTGKHCLRRDWDWHLHDIGNSSYRSDLASYIASTLSSKTQFDGVFLDDAWSAAPADSDFYQEGTSDDCALPAALKTNWVSYMTFLVRDIKTAVGSKLVILNTGWYSYRTTILAESDGQADENFAHANWEAHDEFLSTSSWVNHLTAMITVIASNRYYFSQSGVLNHTPPLSDAEILKLVKYCYASYLMGVSNDAYSQHYFVPTLSYGNYYWYSDWNIVLGNPISTYSQVSGKSSYRRDFERGIVLVNPTDFGETITLERAFLNQSGAWISSVTMGAREGAILFNDLPDLIQTAVSNPPANATAGSSFSVTDTVKNQGNASAGASITSYYLSSETAKGSGDILLTGSRSVPSLAINGTNNGTITVTIPSNTLPGSYYLLACADSTNLVVESNEGNNCIASVSKVTVSVAPGTISVTPPDGLASSGNQGGPFSPSSKSYTLQNTGGSSINWSALKGQTWVTLSSTSGTLVAGESTTVTVSINSNANSLTSGSYGDTVIFTNTTNGNGNTTRPVSLTVISAVLPSPPTNVSASEGTYVDRVQVTWTASPGATSYTVYRATSLTRLARKTVLGTTSETYFNDTTAVPKTTYYYWVKAANTYGTSNFSAYDAGYRSDGTPPVPTDVSAGEGTYVDRVQVTWTASPGATSYTVYRATSLRRRARKTVLGTTSETFFNDTTATPGRTYYYWIRATNTYGMSNFSAYDAGYR